MSEDINEYANIILSRVKDPRIRIMMCILKEDRPLRAHEISKFTKLSNQLISYHIDYLLNHKILHKIEEDEGVYYMASSFFHDNSFIQGMYDGMMPIVDVIKDNMLSSELCEKGHEIGNIIDNVQMAVDLFLEYVKSDI